MWRLTRRKWLASAGIGSVAGSFLAGCTSYRAGALTRKGPRRRPRFPRDGDGRAGDQGRRRSRRPISGPGTSRICRPRRSDFYRETQRPDGSLLREYEIFAVDREIEIAPGMFFPAWTYNGQVPGPDDPRHRRRPRQGHVQERRVASAHDALSRLASAGNGRRARRAGSACRAIRSSTSSTPIRLACTSITATPFR